MGIYVAQPPNFETLLAETEANELIAALRAPDDSRSSQEYLHWDKVRHLEPPDGLTPQAWWLKLKFDRRGSMRFLPLQDATGTPFSYGLPDEVLRGLHYVDQRCSGEIAMEEVVIGDENAKRHYLVNSLMEEAIRSSQLEGATTSRRVAKELLVSGRPPRDRSELMILNNYRALQFMRENIRDRLEPASIFELHRILTDGTLNNPSAAGRLQRPDEERVAVLDRVDGSVLHTPPPAEQLPARLSAVCEFANDADGSDAFIHPVVRGLVLHFMLGYDHPFEDGNGRVARAIFYWYMRTHGYWLTEYLSISRILRNAPSQYTRAFLLTETDEGDLTYFLIYQLHVIERAVQELHAYVQRKVTEVRSVEKIIRSADGLNYRQLALLSDALRQPERIYSYAEHARYHGVTHETARADLADLQGRGFLVRRRVGRKHLFSPPDDLTRRLEEIH